MRKHQTSSPANQEQCFPTGCHISLWKQILHLQLGAREIFVLSSWHPVQKFWTPWALYLEAFSPLTVQVGGSKGLEWVGGEETTAQPFRWGTRPVCLSKGTNIKHFYYFLQCQPCLSALFFIMLCKFSTHLPVYLQKDFCKVTGVI